jgi:hypothetical protein
MDETQRGLEAAEAQERQEEIRANVQSAASLFGFNEKEMRLRTKLIMQLHAAG